VTGKKTLQSGDALELQVVVTNELPIPLELAELVISYPPGTFSTVDPTKSITEERQPLGTIAARSVRRGTVRSIVFGAQGEDKTIHLSLEYRASGASAIYQASADHAFTIGTSTFAIATDGLHEVVSGQTNDVTISVSSQAKTAMHDVVVSVVYPFGFAANEVVPDEVHGATGADTHVWVLGDFAPGETKKIYLRGVYSGEDGDVRLFKITAGTRASPQTVGVDTVLATGDHSATVKRPLPHGPRASTRTAVSASVSARETRALRKPSSVTSRVSRRSSPRAVSGAGNICTRPRFHSRTSPSNGSVC
jgi:hypothetical protein